MVKHTPDNIIISRTDSIGDTVLTLPVTAILKHHFPKMQIGFMGSAYTRPVIEACTNVDEFIDVNDFLHGNITIGGKKPEAIVHIFPTIAIAQRAKTIGIPLRIGTTNRLYHWATCNEWVRLSRRNSILHEAQLNLKLLQPLGITRDYSLKEIGGLFGLSRLHPLSPDLQRLLQPDKYNLILHPRSQGSAREWGLPHFIRLIRMLDPSRYRIFISGTAKERPSLQPLFDEAGPLVTDITGKMHLDELITFIANSDGLVANSTGPLHIAAALGKDAFGIYPPMRPIHPGRWAPLGSGAQIFVLEKECSECRYENAPCACMLGIEPLLIKTALDKMAPAVPI